VALVYLPYATWHPEFAPAVGVYMAEFMVVDLFLSLAFLRWPIRSPNYFGLVDRTLYRLNWTPLAKATNSAGIAVAAVLLDAPVLALVLAVVLLTLKVGCLVRLVRLPAWRAADASGCVVP
jgi:CDP-diacylglycerol---glycerol-3-phosphate 3-phosphatidyltransferase